MSPIWHTLYRVFRGVGGGVYAKALCRCANVCQISCFIGLNAGTALAQAIRSGCAR